MDPAPPAGALLRLDLPASPAGLAGAQQALAAALAAAGVAPRVMGRAELLVEELVTNVVRHGLPEHAGQTIRLAAWLEGTALHLRLEDGGIAFDPTTAPLPAPAASLAEMVPGGMGLVLLRRFGEALHYERRPAGNLVSLIVAAE
jgi:anti-sigma regulatory factor (Ser/Thr protein kinase)